MSIVGIIYLFIFEILNSTAINSTIVADELLKPFGLTVDGLRKN